MAGDAIDWTQPLKYDATGQPYALTASGKKSYLPPILAAQVREPRAVQWAASQGVTPQNPSGNVPGASFSKGRGAWNSATGTYDQGINGGGLGGALLGGAAVAAPLVAPALLSAGAASAAGGGSAAAGGAHAATAGASGGGWLSGLGGSGAVGTALRYGAPLAGQLINARMQSNAERDANALNAKYADRALADAEEAKQYGRKQFADYQARLQPYQQAGTAALARQSAIMANHRQPQITGAAMVMLRAPNGQTSQVPSNQADHYLAKGAVRA